MLEQCLDAPCQVGLAKLRAGQVDRQRAKGFVTLFPDLHLAAGLFQYPIAQLQDGAVFLCQVDEMLRWHFAKCRVAPADQGFGTDQGLGLQAELGLEAQAHLVAFDGPAQFVLQGNTLTGLGGKVAGIDFHPVAPLGLGAVHGGIGVADERGDIAAVVWVEAYADAGAGEELMLAGLEGGVETRQQLVGDGARVTGLVQARQQDDEFVAPQARHGVHVAHLLFEALCDALEQQVAYRMAEAVVDVLETVQVQEQHGALAIGQLSTGQHGLEPIFEQGAVGQASKGVVMCLIVQLGLCVLDAGDVGEHRHEVRDLALGIAHGTDGQPARVQLAVLAFVVDLALPVPFIGQLMPQGSVEGAVMLARGEQAGGLAQRFDLAVAGDLAEGTVHRTDALVDVGDQHALGRVFEHCGGQLQFFLHQVALGNVPCDGQHTVGAGDWQRARRQFAQANLPVATADMAGEVAYEAFSVELVEQTLAFIEVYPDAKVQRRLVQGRVQGVAGQAAKPVVDLQQQAIVLTGQQQAVW